MDSLFPLSSPLYARIYTLVCQVPPGKVVSYGQVARIVGGCSARQVGYAMAALRATKDMPEVPWQRVINSQGKISNHGGGIGSAIQRQMLEDEGVEFNAQDVIDFDRFGWV